MTRPTLDRDAIVDAALAVLADGGRLSMRTVADRLGVSTMAAYRHVDGRDELGRLALDEALKRRAAGPGARESHEDELDELVYDAILAFEPYPGLADELAHALEDGAPPHALAAWGEAIAGRYGPGAVRLAGWLVRGALEPPARPSARMVALATAQDVAARHAARHAGHTTLGVAKPDGPRSPTGTTLDESSA